MNKLIERALRIAYNDYSSTLNELLVKDNTVKIHERNLRTLATEMYKINHSLSPKLMKDLVTVTDNSHCTRSNFNVKLEKDGSTVCTEKSNYRASKPDTVSFGLNSIKWLGPKIWSLVPDKIKEVGSLNAFKENIKKIRFDQCPCNLCKVYIHGVGYVN